MTDDLVKRLRDTPNWMREGFHDWKDNVRTYDRAPFEAADRIEELEAQRKKTYEALLKVTRLHDEVEAKLAKAVEDAEKYQHAFAAQSRKLHAVLHIDGVRTTLAELTGGKDD